MGLRAGLDRCEKSRHLRGFDPRTVQPVASRYTDYAIRPTTMLWARPINNHSLFAEACRLTLDPTQPPDQWALEGKWPGFEAHHSPPPGSEFKNMWSSTSTSPYFSTARI